MGDMRSALDLGGLTSRERGTPVSIKHKGIWAQNPVRLLGDQNLAPRALLRSMCMECLSLQYTLYDLITNITAEANFTKYSFLNRNLVRFVTCTGLGSEAKRS